MKTNLRHALLLLLCEGADDVWRLGENVLSNFWNIWLKGTLLWVMHLGNLSHNICHCVKVTDHLNQFCSICMKHDWSIKQHLIHGTFSGMDCANIVLLAFAALLIQTYF